MPRGGKRSGTPGRAYANRTDLNAVPATAVKGQPYGEAGAQLAAQQAVPMGTPAVPPPVPGARGAFDRPTERPDEPITAGLPTGPGPGPEALGPQGGSDIGLQLRALYQAFPNEDLRDLIEMLDE